MKLNKIVAQFTETDYKTLCDQLNQSKADKFLSLLQYYREDKLHEKQIQELLQIKSAAFYTLKSRLSDKIQEYLYKNTTDNRIELLNNIANIEHLLYQTPKETAIGILKKLEKELLAFDMPNEIIAVYKGLKKLHVNSPKYFEYHQLYNKHVAFNLAQDKADELLSTFCKTLCEYYVSRNEDLLAILSLQKKEMFNVCRLYDSHRLKVYKNLLNIHFALFCPVVEEMKDDDTIEDQLKECVAIMEASVEDRLYKNLRPALDFLYFEYYFQFKLYKNAATYYEKIADDQNSILLLNHSCFSFHFLVSKIDWHLYQKNLSLLNEEEELVYVPEPENSNEYIIYCHYKATLLFYKEKYGEAIQVLNTLLNEVSFKNILFAEVNTKLFMSLLLILSEKSDQAEILLKSLTRKISDEAGEEKYSIALSYIKILRASFSSKPDGKNLKIEDLNKTLTIINIGDYAILPQIKFCPNILKLLSR